MEGARLTPKESVHTTTVLEGKVSPVAMLSTQAPQVRDPHARALVRCRPLATRRVVRCAYDQ